MDDIRRKICALFLLLAVVFMGLACGGGGGSAVVWPTLPEGQLYLNQESYIEEQLYLNPKSYIAVNDTLDNTFSRLLANPDNTIWLNGLFFWLKCYGEDGFVLVIEPDDIEEKIARISVAIHPRGLNFTSQTVDFIQEHPDNLFIVMNIITALESGSGVMAVVGRSVIASDIYITAGGYYQREMKAGAQEMVDNYYGSIPFPLNVVITKDQFKTYISQQIYNSTYVGGERITLSEFLSLFLDPWNWTSTDFKVTINLISAITNFMNDISAAEGACGTYNQDNIGNIAIRNPIYLGSASAYRLTGFPSELGGREIIRTTNEDAGYTGDTFLSFNLTRPATVYMAVDPNNNNLVNTLIQNGWSLLEGKTVTAKMKDPPKTATFNLYYKDYQEGAVCLPGNGNDKSMMYFVISDAGIYPFDMDIIATAHATLIQEQPADISWLRPAVKEEGGILVNENGITQDIQTDMPLVHVNFISQFDANVLVNTEKAGAQTAVTDVTDIQFVEHILKNNGFRLIDTYNDQFPAFGCDSQVLQVENILGWDTDIRVPLVQEDLVLFTNMNLLNSPNLIGVYTKTIITDDEHITIWKDTAGDREMEVNHIISYLDEHVLRYRYFISSSGQEVSLGDLLKTIGKNSEGEMTFRILAELPENKSFQIYAGAFIHDYFTNVYDALLSEVVPISASTVKKR